MARRTYSALQIQMQALENSEGKFDPGGFLFPMNESEEKRRVVES
jgi:hypothetical protein